MNHVDDSRSSTRSSSSTEEQDRRAERGLPHVVIREESPSKKNSRRSILPGQPEGELVGINTAIASRNGGYQGIGFAIPSNMAKPIIEMLVKDGKVFRGYLGVNIVTVTNELANEHKRGARCSSGRSAGWQSGAQSWLGDG